jgi:PAT family beta-lactamase induction signal transducer AmpG
VDPARGLTVLFALVLVLTIAAATQDMAIDAYTVALVSREEQGPANGVRASAYRVALVLIGSGMVALAHWLPWGVLFAAAGALFAALGLLVRRVPRLDVPAEARQRWLAPFLRWIGTWRAVPLVAFVLTYKLGEFAIGPMVKPFWVDRGASLLEIGLVPTALGIVLSIAGALAGGAFMQRHGTLTALWALGLPQALSNLAYAAVALWSLPRPALYAASMVDSFAGGLGTAAFLGFFLAVCDKDGATLQYAFLSSLFALTGRLAGAVSGIGAEQWGYGPYFALTFLASLPGLCLVPLVAPWIPARAERRSIP